MIRLSLLEVLIWGGLAAALVVWWRGHGVREQVLEQVRRHCRQAEVQLLDETVALQRVRPVRGPGGWVLRRIYGFEFTATGEDRYPGSAIAVGRHLHSIQLSPHRIH